MATDTPDPLPLPAGIRQRRVDNGRGLRMHVLEAGFDATPDGGRRPAVLLLHGFPELAFSWRKLMLPLAAAGFHVVAPDQRGYGQTTGAEASYDTDLDAFAMPNLVADAIGLADALGLGRLRAVVGHDFGSPVAAWCALLHPQRFERVVLMSAPFGGPPAGGAAAAWPAPTSPAMHDALARLAVPRKHYQRYYATRAADRDMRDCPEGLHAFLRAYYHMKSADWSANRPEPLPDGSPESIARLPRYYVMDASADMPASVRGAHPGEAAAATCRWLTDAELAVYADAFGRGGFQGGLNWYRAGLDATVAASLARHAGLRIDIPSAFIAGASDWGVYQKPGDFERMQREACTRMDVCRLLPGAGHWVQQEQPDATLAVLLPFLAG